MVSAAHFAFEAIGTKWAIDLTEAIAAERQEALYARIRARIDQFDRAYSRFREDSLLSSLTRQSGSFVFPPDAEQLFGLYEELYRITNGAVTPLIGQVLVDAGYDKTYSLEPKALTHPPAWEEVLAFQRPTTLITQRPLQLDVGGLGKGYAIDLIAELLIEEGIHSFCVEAGGDMIQRSTAGSALRVGLEDPEDPTQVLGVATISNASICGSAGNRRRWKSFHHIIDPHRLVSPEEIAALWVVASTTLLADAMTTALFFARPEVLQEYYRFEYLILHQDRSIRSSSGFPAELFLAAT